MFFSNKIRDKNNFILPCLNHVSWNNNPYADSVDYKLLGSGTKIYIKHKLYKPNSVEW